MYHSSSADIPVGDKNKTLESMNFKTNFRLVCRAFSYMNGIYDINRFQSSEFSSSYIFRDELYFSWFRVKDPGKKYKSTALSFFYVSPQWAYASIWKIHIWIWRKFDVLRRITALRRRIISRKRLRNWEKNCHFLSRKFISFYGSIFFVIFRV